MATLESPTFRSAQIILIALIIGLLTLTAASIFLRMNTTGVGDPEMVGQLLIVDAVIFVSSAVTYAAIRPRFLAKVGASKDEALALIRQGRLPLPLHQLAIFGAALAEAPGLFGAIVYILGGPAYALVAPVLSIFAIIVLIPNRDRTEELVRGSSAA